MAISWYEMTNPMVQNGNFMARNDQSYGTKLVVRNGYGTKCP